VDGDFYSRCWHRSAVRRPQGPRLVRISGHRNRPIGSQSDLSDLGLPPIPTDAASIGKTLRLSFSEVENLRDGSYGGQNVKDDLHPHHLQPVGVHE
jgi:hypothetical protein